MKNLLKDKKNILILLITIGVQICLLFSLAAKKEGYFIDEVLSFSLANREGTGYFEPPVHVWTDPTWYLQNMTAQEGHLFDFNIPYNNQVQDVSLPLFYALLHGVCSLFPGQLSHWMGIGLNTFFYIGCIVLMYFLGTSLLKNKKAGLLIAFLFGITYGALNCALFLRMYMQATFMLLLHVFVYVHYLESEKVPKIGYALFVVSAVLGSLTQYYFLIGAVCLGVWHVISLLHKKQYFNIIKYLIAAVVSGVLALSIFPAMLRHILKSGRGTASFDSLANGENLLDPYKETFRILNDQMFGGFLLLLIAVLLIGHLYFVFRKKDPVLLEGRSWIPVAVAAIGYFVVVTKVAPYQTDRYIMPVYPLAYLLIVCGTYKFIEKLVRSDKALLICLVLFGTISISQLINMPFHYLYVGYNQQNVAEEYTDDYCVVISDNHGYWYYDLQALTQYKSFFWLMDTENESLIENITEKVFPEGEFVLYGRNTWSEQEIVDYIHKNFGDNWICDKQAACSHERFVIYHCYQK